MKPNHLVNPLPTQSDHHLRVFFKSGANLVDCLELMKALKINALVNKAILCLGKKQEGGVPVLQQQGRASRKEVKAKY